MDTDLHLALCNSISEETQSITAELMEAGLDSVMDDGLLKEVPILSVAVSLYKIGHSVKERHYVRNLAAFITALNKGIIDDEKRDYYRSKMIDNPKQRDKELEYILVIIDRYIHPNKAEKLARAYLRFLDTDITWLEYAKTAETLDRLLPGDYDLLASSFPLVVKNCEINDSFLRLTSHGLIMQTHDSSPFVSDGNHGMMITASDIERIGNNEVIYERTPFGDTFINCTQ